MLNTLFISFLPLIMLLRLLDESHTQGLVKSPPQFLSEYPLQVSGLSTYFTPFRIISPVNADFMPSACQNISKELIALKSLLAPYPTWNAISFLISNFQLISPASLIHSG